MSLAPIAQCTLAARPPEPNYRRARRARPAALRLQHFPDVAIAKLAFGLTNTARAHARRARSGPTESAYAKSAQGERNPLDLVADAMTRGAVTVRPRNVGGASLGRASDAPGGPGLRA